MNKPVLVVDFDDVIVPTLLCAVELCNKAEGTNLTVEDFKDWDVTKVHPSFHKYFYGIDFTGIEDKNNAIYWLGVLNYKYEIVIATASHVDKFKEKEIWIKKYLTFVDPYNIMCVRNKSVLRGFAIIDDGVHNFGGDFEYKFLYSTPANASFEEDGAIRVNDLGEVWQMLADK
ncbi:MAG: 5' nucleotidase, NT5C type [Cetobacterium sp.]